MNSTDSKSELGIVKITVVSLRVSSALKRLYKLFLEEFFFSVSG